MSDTEIIILQILLIRIDGGTQSRAELNQAVIRNYTQDMLDDVEFDPVEVVHDGEFYWLWDGFHRIAAAIEAGFKEFSARVRQGTRRDAVLLSVGANKRHGLQRTNADKRRAVTKLLTDDEWKLWSDRDVAKQCGVSDSPLSAVCGTELSDNGYQIERKVTRGGTTYTMQTGNIGRAADQTAVPATETPAITDPGDRQRLLADKWYPVNHSRHIICGVSFNTRQEVGQDLSFQDCNAVQGRALSSSFMYAIYTIEWPEAPAEPATNTPLPAPLTSCGSNSG
jgi:hypothetical protein